MRVHLATIAAISETLEAIDDRAIREIRAFSLEMAEDQVDAANNHCKNHHK